MGSRFNKNQLVIGLIILALVLGGGFYFIYQPQKSNQLSNNSNKNTNSENVIPDSSSVISANAGIQEEEPGVYELETGDIDTSDWLTYRNEEYGFEVKYPKDWSASVCVECDILSRELLVVSENKEYITPVGIMEPLIYFYLKNDMESNNLYESRFVESQYLLFYNSNLKYSIKAGIMRFSGPEGEIMDDVFVKVIKSEIVSQKEDFGLLVNFVMSYRINEIDDINKKVKIYNTIIKSLKFN